MIVAKYEQDEAAKGRRRKRGRPPGLRFSIPHPREFDHGQKTLTAEMLEEFPTEVKHIILKHRLDALKIDPADPSYTEWLSFPKYFRRFFGKRGWLRLHDDDEIEKYIDRSFHFRQVFGSNGLTYRDISLLQTIYPSTPLLAQNLGRELAFSFITQLNLCCGNDPDFLTSLRSWGVALGRLEALRIKYIVYLAEVLVSILCLQISGLLSNQNVDQPLPWEDPLWSEVLNLCVNLTVFLLKTPLPLSLSDDFCTASVVASSWAKNLRKVQRIYVFHSYDDMCDVGDAFWFGSHTMLRRTVDASEGDWWREECVRPDRFKSSLARYWLRIPEEDVDGYDSEAWADKRLRSKGQTGDHDFHFGQQAEVGVHYDGTYCTEEDSPAGTSAR
ncbi:hypothetical protein CVT26_000654 [Gymnopilus dilepis]|uniref:Uncharacterized protein n=1 Tax=Gymnopilus dilepis TaxID=231916 RepID=A0A409Y2P9_9AGAR|nr:hypothetical protein CVT26_000654 [Gymnopilus dilepis]